MEIKHIFFFLIGSGYCSAKCDALSYCKLKVLHNIQNGEGYTNELVKPNITSF